MYIKFLNDEMRNLYGRKMYKLSLDGAMTCPNRDGTIGDRGCIFCSESGSGEFAEGGDNIDAQIMRAKERVSRKAKNCGYIGYFQSFTNTYGDIGKIERLFTSVIERPDIDILSIATRPDCLGDNVLSVLSNLAKKKPLWVELGLQSSNEKTAEYIRRGYKNHVYLQAVSNLKSIGADVITHMIIGLPGETGDDCKATAEFIGNAGGDGVKFHMLYVVRGTDLEKDYLAGLFRCLELEEYAEILSKCIRAIPRDMTVHRITGDGAKKDLVAPLWSGDKKRVLNYLMKYFREHDVEQGENFKPCTRMCK